MSLSGICFMHITPTLRTQYNKRGTFQTGKSDMIDSLQQITLDNGSKAFYHRRNFIFMALKNNQPWGHKKMKHEEMTRRMCEKAPVHQAASCTTNKHISGTPRYLWGNGFTQLNTSRLVRNDNIKPHRFAT